ncbi:MAG: 30S ribosomal protein S4 [Candidatus Methanomethylophilaceae archaeon]|jgi:small subunit ribosomal protein S4|nr:30S ribosomal protein S4 [Candidatus Methanomethylophilaceae archaeon]
MGDPKFPRRSYDTPSHPWQGERIKAENIISKEFGLKSKTELWKAQTILRNFRRQSRELQARLRFGEEQAQREADALLAKCANMGLLPMEGSTLDDVLILSEEKILGRRLQTLVKEKGLAISVGQARQMISHGHIYLDGHRMTVPGYIVKRSEESSIEYNPSSSFNDDMHPMRNVTPRKPYVPPVNQPRGRGGDRRGARRPEAPKEA